MAEILIGTILKPQGIQGLVKVKVYTNDLNRFLHYKTFVLNKKEMKVDKSRIDGQFGYVKFVGINTMNDAETLRDFDLYVKQEDMPTLQKDEYYISDLVGCDVRFANGEPFAKVEDVLIQSKSTVIIATGEKKSYSFPLILDLILNVDTTNKIIDVDEEIFNEVSLIED